MNRLRELRNKTGLSQNKLVSSLNNYLAKNNIKGITAATFSRWENSISNPTEIMWKYLADYFNVSVHYIRGDIDTNKIQNILQTILFFNCSDDAVNLLKTDEFAGCDREDKKHIAISYLMLLIFQELNIDPYNQFLLVVKKVANLLELEGNERDDFIKQGMSTADMPNQKHDIKAANKLLNIYDEI